ncbi:uncharacterized protein LOC111666226 [Seriola lalandi dorsalis]|uniref:uncharacterized protein LOC111666226 n=1 Tax=Seriola lalandi dorsalis TaxID=1841481 RepID=UPI000C6FBCCD|nr:uncharacterized protein LOC111666226 [Seriola lalandi dorsalis]XP_056254024.1 uncharacterized protein LOC130182868 [Seriola aureovittata]
MEGVLEERGESSESGTTSTQVDTPTQNCREHDDEPQNLQEAEGDDRADSDTCDGVVEPSQETLIATNTQEDADCLPFPPLPREEEVTPPSVSSHPSNTENRPSEPCWYCLRSLDSEYRPETAKQEDSDPSSSLPSSAQKVSYQTDPRPHFGVAWSSHSTCRPLWGSEGPCWGQRNQEVPNQMHTCPHCHLGLPPDTLRWHEAKCLLFEGLRNSNK